MNESKYKITDEELDRVILSSAAALPDSPSQRGIRAKGIKRSFSEPLRLLTEYINNKLSALKSGDYPDSEQDKADHCFYDNIHGISLWLDGEYPTPQGNGLTNLIRPSEAVSAVGAYRAEDSMLFNSGADIEIDDGSSPLTLSVFLGARTAPAYLFTLWESDGAYLSVYKISDTLCRVLYRSSGLFAEESYDFTVGLSPLIHFTAVKKDDSLTLYADGAVICTVSIPLFEPSRLLLGKGITATPSPVLIRSLRLFKRDLSPSDVKTEYSIYKERIDLFHKGEKPFFDLPMSLAAPIRELFERTVRDIRVEINNDTFTLSFMPLDANGNSLLSSPHKIDLPLEEMIVGGEYVDSQEHPSSLMLMLKSGSSIYIPVGDLIKGLTHADEFSALDDRVTEAEKELSSVTENTFFAAEYDKDTMGLSFYSRDLTAPRDRVILEDVAKNPYTARQGSAIYCGDVAEYHRKARITPHRKNKIMGILTTHNITGGISSDENEVYYGALGDAFFRFACRDMEDKALYTLSFSANDFHGDFSVGVYNKDHTEIKKNGRNSISFIYDASYDDGTVLFDDGTRTSTDALLYDFTIVKGGGDTFYPILPANSVNVESCGKNLLDPYVLASMSVENGKASLNGDSITISAISGNDCYTYTTSKALCIPVEAGETLCFSWNTDSNDTYGMVYIFGNNSSDFMVFCSSHEKKLVYTVPAGVTFITYRIGVSGIGNSLTYSDLQIERSPHPTEYEPFICGESISVPVNESKGISTLSPHMTVFTRDEGIMLTAELIRSSSVTDAMELALAEEREAFNEKINELSSKTDNAMDELEGKIEAGSSVTSMAIEHIYEGNKVMLKLLHGADIISTLDISDALGAFVSQEFFGGV